MNFTLGLSAFLGVIVAFCCFAACLKNEDRYDMWDLTFLGGLGGTMLLTTPAIFWATPFDAWSFNLSRFFLAGLLVKRIVFPIYQTWQGNKRIRKAYGEAGLRRFSKFHDRKADWL